MLKANQIEERQPHWPAAPTGGIGMDYLIGAFLGVSNIRFWWKGLAALIAVAIGLTLLLATKVVPSPVLYPDGFEIISIEFAGRATGQLFTLLFWYGVGAAVHWVFEWWRRRRGEPSK